MPVGVGVVAVVELSLEEGIPGRHEREYPEALSFQRTSCVWRMVRKSE